MNTNIIVVTILSSLMSAIACTSDDVDLLACSTDAECGEGLACDPLTDICDDDEARPPGGTFAETVIDESPTAYALAEAGAESLALGDWEHAMRLFAEAEAQTEDPFASWAGSSGRVATARMAAMAGDWPWDTVFAVTDEIGRRRPASAEVLGLWNADSTRMSGDLAGARLLYREIAERRPGGVVEAVAVHQLATLDGEGLPQAPPALLAPEIDPILTELCVPTNASDGFQFPFAPDGNNWGNRFMTYDTASYAFDLYHPATDMNAAGDCNINFKPVARGCVTFAAAVSPTEIGANTWGSATVQHYYVPAAAADKHWTSSYGHANLIYFSAGSAVTKASLLGNSDKNGANSCHLHLEIREPDHPNKTNAGYWEQTLASQIDVGRYYEDPEAFIVGHPSYLGYFFADEEQFTCTGTWNLSTDGDVGTGGVGDSKWARPTMSLMTPTAYCRYNFTPGFTATYHVYVHVPWINTSSTNVPYRVFPVGGGANKMTKRLNQGTGTGVPGCGCGGTVYHAGACLNNSGELCDEWVLLGSFAATAATNYTLEIGNHTGESDQTLKLSLDDVLILRRP